MNLRDIAKQRLLNQQIEKTEIDHPAKVVKFMCSMQAQDFPMSKWAIGTRLSGFGEQDVEAAIDNGEIIRTHVMRPTWHLVSADDLHWIIDLTAPQIIQSMKSRWKELEITDSVLRKCYKLIEKAVEGGNHLTREEIVAEFKKANVTTDNNRASHLLACAELKKVICSGAFKAKKPTYASFPERIPNVKPLSREESLATLAKRYFASRGPATLNDFTWWSGLKKTDAKNALESIKSQLISETFDNEVYWFRNSINTSEVSDGSLHLLPAFDEFLISYKDRSASLPTENFKTVVSINGIFWPIVVKEGKIIGIWKRTIKKEKIVIEITFFQSQNSRTKSRIQQTAENYGKFLGKPIEISFKA